MKRACVIGWPISHSRSPLIHGTWLKRYGIEGEYTKVPVEPDALEGFLRGLEANGFSGCNVTIPHKEAVYRLADLREPSAVAVEAANTVWIEDGKICVANTDSEGFMENLDASAPHWSDLAGAAAILGAGGAARAVVYGLLDAGAEHVRVFNRTRRRADELADHFGDRVRACDWDDFATEAPEVSLLVNTTSLGMKGSPPLDVDVSLMRSDGVVADIVYVPLETKLLADARERGLQTVGGLGMLLYQAVPGFEKWFGVRPEVDRELFDLVSADIPKQ